MLLKLLSLPPVCPTNYFLFFLTIFSRLNGISEVEKEVDFLLWTTDNPKEPDILKVGDVFSLHLSHFKADLPTKILIHGFEDTGKVIHPKYVL